MERLFCLFTYFFLFGEAILDWVHREDLSDEVTFKMRLVYKGDKHVRISTETDQGIRVATQRP